MLKETHTHTYALEFSFYISVDYLTVITYPILTNRKQNDTWMMILPESIFHIKDSQFCIP